MRSDKKGSEKYYIIISLILGIMVLALSLYFIFQEYFTQEDIDWESCRQSIVLRSGTFNNALKEVQEKFPLKCKTQVITVSTLDKEEINRQIAEIMAQCWNLWGEGKLKLFSDDFAGDSHICLDCARIHFEGNAISDDLVFLEEYLVSTEFKDGLSFSEYLYRSPVGFSYISFKNNDWLNENKRYSPPVLQTSNGDLIITLIYTKSGFWYSQSGGYSTVIIPHYYYQQLDCSSTETIPA